jgi:hypothetical protein
MCATFNLVAAEAGATDPVTSVVVTRAAVAIAASSFFKVFPFVENIVKLFFNFTSCLVQYRDCLDPCRNSMGAQAKVLVLIYNDLVNVLRPNRKSPMAEHLNCSIIGDFSQVS